MIDRSRSAGSENWVSRQQLFERAAVGDLAALAGYLANGGDIDGRDKDGLALIHHAACQGNIALVRKLREHGADLNRLDDGALPWKPIHYAIFPRQQETEQALRLHGAEAPLPILKRLINPNPDPASQESGTWQSKAGRTAPLAWPRAAASWVK